MIIMKTENPNTKSKDSIERIMQESIEAEKIFNILQNTNSMTQVADIVDTLDESMAKMVLKKFVYSRS